MIFQRMSSTVEESMLLSLDLEHERGVFEEEKRYLASNGRGEFTVFLSVNCLPQIRRVTDC